MIEAEKRNCLSCGKPLKGRIDKKFCDDYCRNNYNNHQRSHGTGGSYIRRINSILAKNRKVLESLLMSGEETVKANKEKLVGLGFQFRYFTHSYTTKTGKTYCYCYDYGYLSLDNDLFLVVKMKYD